jgi:hypothetical protein
MGDLSRPFLTCSSKEGFSREKVTLDQIEEFLKGTDIASEEKRLKIVRAIGMYSVGLFSVKTSAAGDQLKLAGSGTLVQIGQDYFILTARHVWSAIKGWADRLGVTLRDKFDHSHLIDVALLTPFGPEPPVPFSETGPDLVLIRIPEAYAGTIKAFKVFYNLSINEPKRPSKEQIQTWFLMGVPGLTGTYTENHASVDFWGAEVGLLTSGNIGDYDFADINVNVSFIPSPKSVGGVSGGGLWQIYLFEAPTVEGFDSVEVLSGLAFWEFQLRGECRTVRCHGFQSLKGLVSSVETRK